jgi:hypothetical protein
VDDPKRWWLDRLEDGEGREVDERRFTFDLAPAQDFAQRGLRCRIRERGTEPDVTFGPFQLPVVEANVARLIEAIAPDDVELIPIQIVGSNREYRVLHVRRIVDCLDYQRSVYDRYDDDDEDMAGQVKGIYELVVRADAMGSAKIFRIKDDEVWIYVTDVVRDALLGQSNLGRGSFREIVVSTEV